MHLLSNTRDIAMTPDEISSRVNMPQAPMVGSPTGFTLTGPTFTNSFGAQSMLHNKNSGILTMSTENQVNLMTQRPHYPHDV